MMAHFTLWNFLMRQAMMIEIPASAHIAFASAEMAASVTNTSMSESAQTALPIHLAVLTVALAFLRSKMQESQRWEESQAAKATSPASSWAELFSPRYAMAMLYLIVIYGFWNLWAGYNGFFTPYLIAQNNLPV